MFQQTQSGPFLLPNGTTINSLPYGNGNGLLTHLVVVTLIYNVFTNWV